jgi:two-component system nitrate/nitrite response regulator NarL
MCNKYGKLTLRERDILRLVYRGQTSVIIAEQLGITKGTVDVHVNQILRKLNVASRIQAAVVFAECPVCQSTHSIKES